MRPYELKKRLAAIPEFSGDMGDVHKYHEEVLRAWQAHYAAFMNCSVKLPGRDPTGPLTFHKINDNENVKIVYDKNGRVVH